MNDEELNNRILTGLPPHMHFVREGFAVRMKFSVVELKHALIKGEELQKRPGSSDGHALAAGFKPKNHWGRGGGN